MAGEENIKKELEARFDFLKDKVLIKGPRRIWADCPAEKFEDVLDFLFGPLKFYGLLTMTGLDEGTTLAVIYHFSKNGLVLNLKINVPKEKPVIKTVTSRFPSADIYEREIMDLLGFEVMGIGPGQRYPLPDHWPQGNYPLRKDWKMPENV